MIKFLKVLVFVIIFLIAIPVVWMLVNPVRWPDSLIRVRLISLTPLESDFNEVKSVLRLKKWIILRFDEANGIVDKREKKDYEYACNSKGIGQVSEEKRYYECTKSFSYTYACEVTGGKLAKLCKGCIYDVCMVDDLPMPVNQEEACFRSDGKWVLKTIKVSPYCEIGKKSIHVKLGEYLTLFPLPLPLITTTYATWIFNVDGKLIDVYVEKGIDGT